MVNLNNTVENLIQNRANKERLLTQIEEGLIKDLDDAAKSNFIKGLNKERRMINSELFRRQEHGIVHIAYCAYLEVGGEPRQPLIEPYGC